MNQPHSVVRIEVTADDIEDGVRHACEHCPVTLAIRRMFSFAPGQVASDESCVVFGYDDERTMFPVRLPSRAGSFIKEFDADAKVYPFSFDLKIPASPLKRRQPA